MERSNSFPDCFHRVTVKGLCVRGGKILLAREAPSLSGKWELPGGGLDFGEDIKSGFEREIEEEMGVKVSKMSKSPIYAWTHRHEKKRNLDWFYEFIAAYRVEFEDLNFVPSEECQAVQFFSKDELGQIELNDKIKELANIFDAKDFNEPF